MPPTAVVYSGNGVQAVYRFHDLPETPDELAAVERDWKDVLLEIGSDAVQNVDRLARLPGVNAPNAKKRAAAPR